ncbi:hypothetical protein N2152v2_010649 [Parachlorella kessleri]
MATVRSSFFSLPRTDDCSIRVQEGRWTDWPLPASCADSNSGYGTCGATAVRRWAYSPQAIRCGARRYDHTAIQGLLLGKRVAFVGDSVTRLLCGALLRASGSQGQVVKLKHQDFEYQLEGDIVASFLWRPFPRNVTEQYKEWEIAKTAPDVVISSVSLWHMLHTTNASAFGSEMAALKGAAQAYSGMVGSRSVLLLGSTTETFTNRQPTARKRKNMTPGQVDAYNEALAKQGLLQPEGPFRLLDMFALTQGCGEECSLDGIHSVDAVYDTALQLMLNIYRLSEG